MKKILALIVLSVFLFSCVGPGAAVSKNVEDIVVNVKPAAANYMIELYSGNLLIGTAVTNSQGVATFYALPIGSYRAVVLDPSGAKVAEKYFSSKWVQRGAYAVTVELKGPVVPVPPPIEITQVCVPSSRSCVDDKTISICEPNGLSTSVSGCFDPQPWCHAVSSSMAYCVACRSDADCPANNVCTKEFTCAPKPAVCGNAKCETGESAVNCPQDCVAAPVCGDGACVSPETSRNCAKDCGSCVDDPASSTIVCNGISCTHQCVTDVLKISKCVFDWSANKFNMVTQNCLQGQCKNGVCTECIPGTTQCFDKKTGQNCDAGKWMKFSCPNFCLATPEVSGCVDCLVKSDCPSGKICSKTYKCEPEPTICGNGVCDAGETVTNCPQDCKPVAVCGNNICETGETTTNCAKDCLTTQCVKCQGWYSPTGCVWRYKGLCAAFKAASGYPECPPSLLYSFSDITKECKSNDFSILVPDQRGSITVSGRSYPIYPMYDCWSCAEKAVTAVCGNAKCESGETSANCLQDCPVPAVCGNGKCEAYESNLNCPKDCPPVCGDSRCVSPETSASCPVDCPPVSVCGNYKCEAGETPTNCGKDCAGCVEEKNTVTCAGQTCQNECAPDLNILKCVFDWGTFKFYKAKQICLNGICLNGVCTSCMPGTSKCLDASTYELCNPEGMLTKKSCSGTTPYCVVTSDNMYKGCYACKQESHCPSGMVCKDYTCSTPVAVKRDFVSPNAIFQCHPQGMIWLTYYAYYGCAGGIWDPVETTLPFLIFYSKDPMPADTSVITQCYWEYGGSDMKQTEQDLVLGTSDKCVPPASRAGQLPTKTAHNMLMNGGRAYTKPMPNTRQMFECNGLRDPNHPWSYGVAISAYPDCYGDSLYRKGFKVGDSLGYWLLSKVQ